MDLKYLALIRNLLPQEDADIQGEQARPRRSSFGLGCDPPECPDTTRCEAESVVCEPSTACNAIRLADVHLGRISQEQALVRQRLSALEAIFETPSGRKLKDQITEELLEELIDQLKKERNTVRQRLAEDDE